MLLLLAGTGAARVIANALAVAGTPAIATLAGATRMPEPLPIETVVGGFGGEQGFRDFLAAHNITAILDATHPFAHRISARSARIAADLSIPYLQFLRPEWVADDGDTWVHLDHEQDAAKVIPVRSTVFLATGRQTLDRFANLTNRTLICRQIDPPNGPFPFPNGEFLIGRPPFSVEDEVALFQQRNVDWLVVKNAGGLASRSKLDAARQLGIPVAMIRRPAQPDCARTDSVADAIKWAMAAP